MKLTSKEACTAVLCATTDLTEDEVHTIADYAETGESVLLDLAKAGYLQFQYNAGEFALNPFLHVLCTTRRVVRGTVVSFAQECGLDHKFIESLFEEEVDFSTMSFDHKREIILLYLFMLRAGWHFVPMCDYPNIKESCDERVPFVCPVVQPLIDLDNELNGTCEEFATVTSEELARLFTGKTPIREYLSTHPECSVDILYEAYRDAISDLCCMADCASKDEPKPITMSSVLELARGIGIHYNCLYQLFGLPYLSTGTPILKSEVVLLFGYMRSLNLYLKGDLPSGAYIKQGHGHDPFVHPYVEAFLNERIDDNDSDDVQSGL